MASTRGVGGSRGSGVPRLKQEDLVGELVPDPSQPPNVRILFGFLGDSPQSGTWRLYLTPTFDEFLEIREEDIVHQRPQSTEQSSLGGTFLWIKRDAPVAHTRLAPSDSQASFLRGQIAASFLRRAGIGGGFGGGQVAAPIKSIPPEASVCFSCPTEGGEDTCVPATCTLSTTCRTQFLCL